MTVYAPDLSIGVLAHNEEQRIGKTLQTLFAQDVFHECAVELVIVANGCTDKTATVARRMLADHQAVWSIHGSARVEELVAGGKANAWNQFVHELSSPLAPMLVLMDADIEFLNKNTISSMVSTLEKSPEAVVCVDRPVKDIEIKSNPTLFERLLLSVTPQINPDYVPLCGQLYCARSAAIREIRLPLQITCEDGFIRALLLTQGFTVPENPRRIVLDHAVAHKFESVATIQELFKHEAWIVAGSIINMMLYRHFSALVTPGRSAMTLMRDWQARDSEWLPRYIESQVKKRGWHLLPGFWWTRRWSRLDGLPLRRRLSRLPVAIIATAVDIIIFFIAIKRVRRGSAFQYWDRK